METPVVRVILPSCNRIALLGLAGLTLRSVGSVLPIPVLWSLLGPVAMSRSAWELSLGRPRFGEFRKLSGTPILPSGERLTRLALILGRTRLNLTKLLFLWPEWLARGRVVKCRITGADRLQAPGERGSPALLLTLHFGPMNILLNWLRARGHPAAMVALKGRRSIPWLRRHLAQLRDAPVGLAMLPSLIEVGQIWEMQSHLEASGILLVAVDGGYGRYHSSPVADGLALSMSTGALQLASLTGATVIPCLIRSGRLFSFTIHFGEPLPAADVADRTRHSVACDHLFREFLPILAMAPEECSYELLGSLRKQATEGAAI